MRRIVAMCGGFSLGIDTVIDAGILALTGAPRPRVLFVPTASGDSADYVARFYAAFARRAEASHVALFKREVGDLDALCGQQDVIYVGGGNTANMLAVWKVHGFDRALRAAYEAGVILCGISAGAICWFEDGVTDSYGLPLRPLGAGLGWLRGALAPHYDGDPGRRPALHQLVAGGTWRTAFAIDDASALVFEDEALAAAWSGRAGAGAYRVALRDGAVIEDALAVSAPRA
jgi:dipeptidase E